jgi:hypothetical protein
MKLLRLRRRSSPAPGDEHRLEASAEGFYYLGSGKRAQTVNWSGVLEIDGFKRDQITADLICLTIKYNDGEDRIVEINEEMRGFCDVVSALEGQGFLRPTWRKVVILPPFDTRRFVLFTSSKKSMTARNAGQ